MSSNHNRMAEAAELRNECSDRIGKLCREGQSITEIKRITGKSHSFVRRVIDENGFILLSQIEAAPGPVAKPVTDKRHAEIITTAINSTAGTYMRISLPREPFEIEPTDRRETAPLGNSYIVSRPYSPDEIAAREAWRAGRL